MTPTTHRTTATRAGHGYLAACACGWRAAFPSFSEHVARRQADRHHATTGGAA